MSLEHHVFLAKESVPSRKSWQEAIDKLGFDFQIDPELEPFKDSGFLPCKLNGQDSGFEIYYEPAEEVVNAYGHIKEEVAGRDYCISFRWTGDMAECACVLIASAALTKYHGALVYYPEDDLLYESEGLIREARTALDAI